MYKNNPNSTASKNKRLKKSFREIMSALTEELTSCHTGSISYLRMGILVNIGAMRTETPISKNTTM